MIRITAVEKDSPAELAGLVTGDTIEWINGQRVEDFLDFLFLTSDAELEVELADGRSLVVFRQHGQALGLEIDQGRIARCGCNCLFCFVHQLPAGLRKSLYVKDEDYRHSFLYGNFITGSNLRKRQLDRIEELGLSPLYISVHATNPILRHRMLGGCGLADILELLVTQGCYWFSLFNSRFISSLIASSTDWPSNRILCTCSTIGISTPDLQASA